MLVLDGATLNFGERRLFDSCSLRIAGHDRIGLLGANGTGKSTMLKILAGVQTLDKGTRQISKHVKIGFLTQDLHLQSEKTLIDFIIQSVPGRGDLEKNLTNKEKELETLSSTLGEDELIELGTTVAELHEKLNFYEENFSKHQGLRILAGLGFRNEDESRPLSEFSGGWKMRAMLAALLFQQPDLLLLDEPTNHLDMPSVAWFSSFLKKYSRSFVLISHDKEFLNEQINRVVSLEPEGIKTQKGNYEKYVLHRKEEEQILENKAKNLAREREHMQKFVDRFRAQANKAAAVQSRVKALAKMENVELFQRRKILKLRFPPIPKTVSEVAKIKDVSKSYGALKVLENINLTVNKGQKVGLIGPNGAGKTTLLRTIAGEIAADKGSIRFGSHVQMGYYAQHHAETLHADTTVYNTLYQHYPDAGPAKVRQILGAFLFSGDDVEKKIGVLSGGERARVALARLFIKPVNLLLMDEPTNHLDLESSQALAEGLERFDGTVLFVSHNKHLVRKVATHIWQLENNNVEDDRGTFDDHLYSCRLREENASSTKQVAEPSKEEGKRKSSSKKDEKERKRKEAEERKKRSQLCSPLEKKIKKLEETIATLESVQEKLSAELADSEVYNDEKRRNKLLGTFQDGAEELERLNSRWEKTLLELEEIRKTLVN